ncbi:MAG: response regulator [Planctomycetota bacterium]
MTRAALQILLVEDEPSLRRVLARGLAMHGFEVTAAELPEEAIAHVRSGSRTFDAIVSDLDLPVMDGIELLTKLRAAGCAAPFLLCTGFLHDDGRARAKGAGVAAILTKPILAADIAKAVHTAVARTS